MYSGIGTFMSGTPIGRVFDASDVTNYYGSHVIKGNTFTLRNNADSPQSLFIEPGNTADQDGAVIFTDKTPTTKITVKKAADNTFQILDAASVLRLLIGNATNSSTGIGGSGTGAVQLNLNANSGTSGVQFGSGGASPTVVGSVDSAGKATLNGGVVIHNVAAPTAGANEVALGSTTATTVGAAGGASAPPATPVGYLIINVAGTNYKVPYYNN